MANIIAFSGKKQAGKTTAVEDLSSRLWDEKLINAEQLNFADQLKRLVLDYFIGPDTGKVYCISDLDSEKFKTTVHSCGKTYRELLQIVGTGQFRGLWPDVWVKNYKQCLPDGEDFILTADVRFPNEVKCIQDLGGHVIRLLRNPHDDQHESETALDYMEHRSLQMLSGQFLVGQNGEDLFEASQVLAH